ncbi:hypothetical protein BT67DRAFT_18439 [Trichocladium antarcticum]|uniref:Secreted protein n=1 Tax=Trichocladium antarcticum TaxID=1450529 RepID=A0AAN6ZGV8_9PEZI|nr:hypothetical protein BT67DRAFT_18439 [Trichocladium antarcticum]
MAVLMPWIFRGTGRTAWQVLWACCVKSVGQSSGGVRTLLARRASEPEYPYPFSSSNRRSLVETRLPTGTRGCAMGNRGWKQRIPSCVEGASRIQSPKHRSRGLSAPDCRPA